jgi:hypothetical protein
VMGRQRVQQGGLSLTSGTRAWIHTRALGLGRCVTIFRDIVFMRLTRMQLSAQLKTRLSYAMVKVQNGWEKQSLEELEEVHSQRGSPNSAPGGPRPTFDSPSTADYRRRPSGVSENSDQMITSPASDSIRSHAINTG